MKQIDERWGLVSERWGLVSERWGFCYERFGNGWWGWAEDQINERFLIP